MSYILDIATAVPEYSATKEELVKFYAKALGGDAKFIEKKLALLTEKTRINSRYSCIPDYNTDKKELYIDGNYRPSIESRMELYKDKIMPLAAKAIDKIFIQNNIEPTDVTHLITVSCTGLFSPGFEFLIAEHYGLQHAEKLALNFLGCYAAIKALKHAHHIAQSEPNACILIVSAELCSLHFYPSSADEDMVANLLFADGAAAVLVCGDDSKHKQNKVVLNIDAIGSVYIPDTMELMTWNISSSAFRMFLSKHIVNAIKDNIEPVVSEFLAGHIADTDHWAIHPGGIRIVDAVKASLQLTDEHVAESLSVLRQYGNMSSPTILFIIERILTGIRNEGGLGNRKVFACAFGPGLNIEMIRFTSVNTADTYAPKKESRNYAIQA